MKIVSDNQIMFFKNNEILRIESVASKTIIYFLDGSHSEINQAIGQIEEQLKASDFIRIHDKHIVNVNYLVRITNGTDDFVELNNGVVLPINGKQKEIIIKLISDHLDKLKP